MPETVCSRSKNNAQSTMEHARVASALGKAGQPSQVSPRPNGRPTARSRLMGGGSTPLAIAAEQYVELFPAACWQSVSRGLFVLYE